VTYARFEVSNVMNTLSALQSRVSVPRLEEPGPTSEQLDALLRAAMRAPDHGLMRPWRFFVLAGNDRHRLGDIFERALCRRQPEADEQAREKARTRPLRAPVVIVAVAEVQQDNPRIPAIDQIMSTAAAVQNMMVAAHEMGVGAMWRTGSWALDPGVKEGLGFAEKDEIVAFLYLGTPAGAVKSIPDQDHRDYLRRLPT
jgi:nitroreductase